LARPLGPPPEAAVRHDRLLCLDIETVPDPDLVPADWPAGKFVPNPLWHRVVAISFVEARLEAVEGRERYLVACCRTGGEAGWDERRLLQAYRHDVARRKARVVTRNGRGFDLPVLRPRAMIHGLSAAGWFQGTSKWEGDTPRHASDWHCGLGPHDAAPYAARVLERVATTRDDVRRMLADHAARLQQQHASRAAELRERGRSILEESLHEATDVVGVKFGKRRVRDEIVPWDAARSMSGPIT
jgi:hypothetical protein